MANASIGGLISGLDTATIISQLMQLEAIPQTNLKNRVSSEQLALNAMQTLNSKLAGIATKAADLAQIANWSPTKATSDNEGVTVRAGEGASASSLSFTVGAVATSARSSFTTTGALDDEVMTPGLSYRIDFDDADKEFVIFSTGDGSMQSIADAINEADAGLQATLVKTGTAADGDAVYRLHVASVATGADSGFSFTNVDPADPANPAPTPVAFMGGEFGTPTVGSDASITIGGQTLTSSSNTFTGLMPGVDVTLGAAATGSATITIARDSQSLVDSVKSLVDSVNLALDDIASLTSFDTASQARGLLVGDSTLRTIKSQLIETVTGGVNGQSLAPVGIQVDRTGKIVFDAAKLKDAYAADPTGTAAKFAGSIEWNGSGTGTVDLQGASWRTQPGTYAVVATAVSGGTIGGGVAELAGNILTAAEGSPAGDLSLVIGGDVNGTVTYTQGLASKLEALTQRMSNADNGVVTSVIKGRTSMIERMEEDIASWDVRLDTRQEALKRQYAALEVALGKLQNQSSWLAGQIGSLPKMSSE